MKTFTLLFLICLFTGFMGVYSQTVPELMYYHFDAAGNQQNYASAPVGTNPAPLTGMTIGSAGQFGTALEGNGGASSSNQLNTGWATSLPSTGWTISLWVNSMPSNTSLYYLFGDINATSFRCFIGGAAGAGSVLLRGGGLTDVTVTGVAPGPTALTFVYTGSSIKAFKNGVLAVTVTQPAVTITGTGPFMVGSYGTTTLCIPAGSLLDEFRMYNRALSDAEVSTTWGMMLPGGPTMVTTAATGLTSAGATLNGSCNANNISTTVTFEYGLTTAYGSTIAGVPGTVTGNSVTPILTNITGLVPNTLYHYRIVGNNGSTTVNGNDMTFTTLIDPPIVTTTAGTAISMTGATLNGTVNANSGSAAVTFEYGLTTSYGSTVAGVPSPVTGNTPVAVSATIGGLTQNTTYHCRAVGVNAGGTTNGNDIVFVTPGAPVVVTDLPTNVTPTGAQMNGTITANNLSTTVTFEYGLTTSYGTVVAATPGTVTGTTPTNVIAVLTGLPTGVTYHYRAVGVNAGGTIYGNDQTFLTGCQPPSAAGTISGPVSVCQNGNGYVYSVGTITNALSYLWTLPTGGTVSSGAGTTSITVSYSGSAVPGNVTVAGVGSCGNGLSSSLSVTVNPMPAPTITGLASACQGSSCTYSTQAGMTGYTWTVSAGGTITSGPTTNTIAVTWATTGTKTVTVNYANATGCTAAVPGSLPVTVNPAPSPTIAGSVNHCVNSGYYNYTTETGFSSYQWTISPGGIINYGSGTNMVTVSWNGSGAQWIAVNYNNPSGCAAATPTTLNVNVNPPPSAASGITGPALVCAGENAVSFSTSAIAGATAYVWSLPPGATIASGTGTNNITVDFSSTATTGNVTVYGNNICGNGAVSAPLAVGINPLPATAGTITGDDLICGAQTGVTYSVDPIENATGYVWTLPAGATITAGSGTASITVDYASNAESGQVSVYGTNSCGEGGNNSIQVTVNPVPATPVVFPSGVLELMSSSVDGNQWYFSATAQGPGTPISAATNQFYLPEQTGWYWTVITINGCSSDTSNHYYVVITGMPDPDEEGLSIYPVPNEGSFTISRGTICGDLKISIINNLGQIIWRNELSSSQKSIRVDLGNVNPGLYSVILNDGRKPVIRKVLVK